MASKKKISFLNLWINMKQKLFCLIFFTILITFSYENNFLGSGKASFG
jgi:hypothetical protein